MSIGLEDLRRKSKPSAAKSSKPTWTRTKTARPWDVDGLQKISRSRPRANLSEFVVNDDWSAGPADAVLPQIGFCSDPLFIRLGSLLRMISEQTAAIRDRQNWLIHNIVSLEIR